jgi:RNA 2',3'-cyclic 3'-phosphodiesterase
MRVFIGVELPDEIKTAAAATAERLRRELQHSAPSLTARWTAVEQYHITLWFIGEVDERRGADVSAAFGGSAMTTPVFDLALAGCGAFPPSGPPRVFWIGARAGAAGMASLYGEVGQRLAPLGFEPEHRAYSAHLTIARIKEAGRGTSRTVREILGRLPSDCGACRVSAVTLFRSRLSPRGATYEPLLRVPLS